MCIVEAQSSFWRDVNTHCCTSLNPVLSFLVVTAPLSPSNKQEFIRPSHFGWQRGSGAMFSVDSLMDKISARLTALERGVQNRDAHIQHLYTMFQQSALQAQPGTTSVPQRDLHREMLARVKSLTVTTTSGLVGGSNAVLSTADKKLSSSLCNVLGRSDDD